MASQTTKIPSETKKSFENKSSSKSVVRAPIDRWGYIGLWIRRRLLESIKVGTPVNLVLQKHRTPFLNKLMSTCSFLGTEEFFTVLAMVISWIIDARLGRLFTILLALGFYCSSFFKCLLCLPRPPSPPVYPLHREDLDWAFPSNHGIMGVIAPWYLWFYCFLHYQSSTPVQLLLFIAVLLWSVGVIFSRIYLGVHSPADMVGGGIVGVTILSIYLLVDDYIDYQCAAGRYVIPQAMIIVLGLFALHPRTVPETQSFSETVIVGSCALGCVIARASILNNINKQSLWDVTPSDYQSSEIFKMLFARLIIGCSIVFISRLILKHTFKFLCEAVYKYFDFPCYSFSSTLKTHPSASKHLNRSYRLPPFPGKEKSTECSEDEATSKSDNEENDDNFTTSLPYDVDIPTRIFCYIFLGWFLSEGAYIIFHLLRI